MDGKCLFQHPMMLMFYLELRKYVLMCHTQSIHINVSLMFETERDRDRDRERERVVLCLAATQEQNMNKSFLFLAFLTSGTDTLRVCLVLALNVEQLEKSCPDGFLFTCY